MCSLAPDVWSLAALAILLMERCDAFRRLPRWSATKLELNLTEIPD